MDPFSLKVKPLSRRGEKVVSGKYRQELEWQESLISGAVVDGDDEARLEDVPERSRLTGLILVIAAVLVVLTTRMFDLQIVEGESYQQAAEINRVRKFPLTAPRGVMFDRTGRKLMENVPSFEIVLIPADLWRLDPAEKEGSILSLVSLAEIDEVTVRQAVEQSVKNSYEPKIIQENTEREKALILEAKKETIPGFQVLSVARRNYFNPIFSHLLGYTGSPSADDLAKYGGDEAYTGINTVGKNGLESIYDRELRGFPGSKQIEVDATGREENLLAIKQPVAGKNIELTIDGELQAKIAENLDHILNSARLTKGSVIALDPRNGEVLAMVSRPGYDNNLFAQGISSEGYAKLVEDPNQPLFNRSIGGTYASGSVIKPLIGVAALQEGIINVNTTVVDVGYIEVENKYDPSIKYRFYGWNRDGLGPVNIYTAIALSSNPYFYQIGGGYQGFEGLGPERIAKYMTAFGFGAPLKIDLPGEAKGLVPTPDWKEKTIGEPWSLGNTYNLAIGQGDFLTTPLQMANEVATIANGGTVYRPRLARAFIDEADNSREELAPEILNDNIASSENFNIIRRAMREAVINERGTARSFQGLPVAVAAKTGTAQFQGTALEHSWFIAFAPYEKPTMALAVLVEQGGSGAEAAAIVARDTLEWYFGR